MYDKQTINQVMMTAKTTTGVGTSIQVQDFQHKILTLIGANTAAFTVKVQGSNQDVVPDFSAAATGSNQWTFIQCTDLADGTAIDGATGVTFSANGLKMLKVVPLALRWISLSITAVTTGNLTASILASNNS